MTQPSTNVDPATRLYQGEAGKQYHELKRGVSAGALEWVMKLRAQKFQPQVKAQEVVFELGVGPGWNLATLQCSRKMGCDASEFLAATLKTLGIEFVANISSVPDESVDVVLCHHALEHLLEPANALRESRRILK